MLRKTWIEKMNDRVNEGVAVWCTVVSTVLVKEKITIDKCVCRWGAGVANPTFIYIRELVEIDRKKLQYSTVTGFSCRLKMKGYLGISG